MLDKYLIIKKISLPDSVLNNILIYIYSETQIIKNNALNFLIKDIKPTSQFQYKLMRYNKFEYLDKPEKPYNLYKIVKKFSMLNNFDNIFITLHEKGWIKCSKHNYRLTISNKGKLITKFLLNKNCICKKNIQKDIKYIIKNYIIMNNQEGLDLFLKHFYKPSSGYSYEQAIEDTSVYNSSEGIIDIFKERIT